MVTSCDECEYVRAYIMRNSFFAGLFALLFAFECTEPNEKPKIGARKRIWLENGALSKPASTSTPTPMSTCACVRTCAHFIHFLHFCNHLSNFQISYVCTTRIRFASPGRICWADEMSEKFCFLEFDLFIEMFALRVNYWERLSF